MEITFGRVGIRFLVSFALLAAVIAGAFASSAEARPASADVSILPYVHGVFGTVESGAGTRCEANRRVNLFIRKSRGSKFRLVGQTRTRKVTGKLNPDRGSRMWRFRSKVSGSMFVRVKRKRGCASAKSGVIKSVPRNGNGRVASGDVPSCTSKTSSYCRLDQLHFDSTLCPSLTKYAGKCAGYIYGPRNWMGGGGNFHWSERVGGYLQVSMSVYSLADMSVDDWQIFGSMTGPDRAEWQVVDAFNRRDGNPVNHWEAADLDVPAGQLGGPLYLNFVNGVLGADVYVHGYLYRKD